MTKQNGIQWKESTDKLPNQTSCRTRGGRSRSTPRGLTE